MAGLSGTFGGQGKAFGNRKLPASPEGRTGSESALRRLSRSGALLPIAGAIAIPALALGIGADLSGVAGYLPTAAVDLAQSFLRMLIAYLLSLGFALLYGYYAAVYRPAERVMIPVLDILQSIPILGFFPLVIVVCISLTPGSPIGPNLGSILLIFTSMAWNMVFGVYESVKSLPNDLKEAADSFGAHGSQRVRQLFLPATVNRLVYNSVLSWTAGWYFLVAAEIISVGPSKTTLPGIGSYLLSAAGAGNGDALIAGIVLLIVLIALLDIFVWRPLSRWAEKYRYDVVPSGEPTTPERMMRGGRPLRRVAGYVARGMATGVARIGTPFVRVATYTVGPVASPRRMTLRTAGKYIAIGTILVMVWLLLITLVVNSFRILTGPIPTAPYNIRQQIEMLPLAILTSFGRVVLAYILSLALALGLAFYLFRRPSTARIGLPVVEIVASVPATALFPLFIFALLPVIGFQGAAILMLVTGMVWYLFFNILSGLRAIPPDLEEAARSYGLGRREYYRRLVLPAIFPALITGSITAFGGGWNTLIIAEYLHYSAAHHFEVLGVGELIDKSIVENSLPLLVSALLSLVFTVVLINELLWKPLYRRAVERYRYD
ncbi:MAG: ABC transporter permease subunit [Thermoplasmata archaeon]|nr:ABC transporter permease subunit [Thermoplasmata archaeon]